MCILLSLYAQVPWVGTSASGCWGSVIELVHICVGVGGWGRLAAQCHTMDNEDSLHFVVHFKAFGGTHVPSVALGKKGNDVEYEV